MEQGGTREIPETNVTVMVCYTEDAELKVSEALGSKVSVQLEPVILFGRRERDTENRKGVNYIKHDEERRGEELR